MPLVILEYVNLFDRLIIQTQDQNSNHICNSGNSGTSNLPSMTLFPQLSPWLSQPSSPQSEPAWSPPDSRRSTLDLVETCVLTLILCSWSVVHPDIPPQGKKRRWAPDRLFCALRIIILPLYFLGVAFEELWESRLICLELKNVESKKREEHGNPEVHCTNDQGHNQDVPRGSIGVFFRGLWHPVWRTVYESCGLRHVCEAWRFVFPPELVRGFYTEMGGFVLVSGLRGGEELPNSFRGRVTSQGAIELARVGLLPKVSLKLIEDQSKSDKLAKVLVCLQASWMVIQCIARVARSIPLTLLEVHTLVNATCAFFMYLLWFRKPQDVMGPTEVKVNAEMLKTLQDIDKAQEGYYRFADHKIHGLGLNPTQIPQPKNTERLKIVMAMLMPAIYGGVHLTVWKGHFPTNLERILWVTSTLFIMVMPFLTFCVVFPLSMIDHWWVRRMFNFLDRLFQTLSYLTIFLYFCARLYLFVEAFASLRSLPLGSYTAISWTSFIPHF